MSDNSENPLRIGMVGAGSIVKDRHLPGLNQLDGIEILAVSNSTFESSEHVCTKLIPGATPVKNWADLIAMTELDIIWIGTPPYLHMPVTLSALEAGKHVFCQARMAMDASEAETMQEASRSHPNLITMLCPPPQGMKSGSVFRQTLAENRIGEIQHLRLQSLSGAFADRTRPAHWRQRAELSGLNVLTLGIYAEVLQSWIAPITSVHATGKIFTPERNGYSVKIPDQVSVLCEFSNGARGTLEFSGVAAHAPGDRLEVYGSKGTLVYDFANEVVLLGDTHDEDLHEVQNDNPGGWTVERDFIDAVRNPDAPRPSPTFADGLRYMRVVQAVADSISSGKQVTTGNA